MMNIPSLKLVLDSLDSKSCCVQVAVVTTTRCPEGSEIRCEHEENCQLQNISEQLREGCPTSIINLAL